MPQTYSNEPLLHLARSLAPDIAIAREEIETARRLPLPLVEKLQAARLFKLWLPRVFGGPEIHPAELVEVIEALAIADGAVAWCATNAAVFSLLAGSLPEAASHAVFNNDGVVAGSVNPTGHADAVPGGFRASGRWAYASGIDHATWVVGNCIIHEDGAPRRADGGPPEMRFLFFPLKAVDVIDTWHVSGLKGTGSNDFQVKDVFVDEAFTMPAFTARPQVSGLLYRVPPLSLFAVALASVTLGIARAAIDALMELTASKTPMGSATLLRERSVTQIQIARAEAFVRAARAHLLQAISLQWDEIAGGVTASLEGRAAIRLATSFCAEACANAVDLVHAVAGGNAIHESGRIARCWRDIHAATQHIGLNAMGYEMAGRVLLGLDPGTSRF